MWPAQRIAGIVNDGQNVNQIIFDRVKNAIWKPWQECPANARNNFRVQKRNLYKAFKLQFKSQLEFRAQPFTLFFVPIERFANFANSPTGKLQAVRHEPVFKCVLT